MTNTMLSSSPRTLQVSTYTNKFCREKCNSEQTVQARITLSTLLVLHAAIRDAFFTRHKSKAVTVIDPDLISKRKEENVKEFQRLLLTLVQKICRQAVRRE
jgi:hypothetical protein